MDIFSDDHRRDPYSLYAQLRGADPVVKVPPPFDAWMVCHYEGVARVLHDHQSFSSRVPAPPHWFIFDDPPTHTRCRALISSAFTQLSAERLEPFVHALSCSLLDPIADGDTIDLASEFATPLAMKVIAHIIGAPTGDWSMFRAWSDSILELSHARGRPDDARTALAGFAAVTADMTAYLAALIAQRRVCPHDDVLSRLVAAEQDSHTLAAEEIVGFVQLLIVAGHETTVNLIDNAILSLLAHPDQLELLRTDARLMPSVVEETLRYRSPLQWVMRTPTRSVDIGGHRLAPGQLVLAVIGAANRDAARFDSPNEFDITRDPNPHLAFGRGVHFCLGARLARMEARIALSDLLKRFRHLERADDRPWEPRRALHVHGPASLRVRLAR